MKTARTRCIMKIQKRSESNVLSKLSNKQIYRKQRLCKCWNLTTSWDNPRFVVVIRQQIEGYFFLYTLRKGRFFVVWEYPSCYNDCICFWGDFVAFQLIDLENWERREFYEHFIKEVVCTSIRLLCSSKYMAVVFCRFVSPVFIKHLQTGEFFPAQEPGKWVDFPMENVQMI